MNTQLKMTRQSVSSTGLTSNFHAQRSDKPRGPVFLFASGVGPSQSFVRHSHTNKTINELKQEQSPTVVPFSVVSPEPGNASPDSRLSTVRKGTLGQSSER